MPDVGKRRYRPTLEALERREACAVLGLGGLRQFGLDEAQYLVRQEAFDREPQNWQASNNRIAGNRTNAVEQKFGFLATAPVEGALTGVVGGQVARSTRPAYYADTRPRGSFETPLHAEGTLFLGGAASNSGVLLGWFNADTQGRGWRPADFLGVRLNGSDGFVRVFVESVTQTFKAASLSAGSDVLAYSGPVTWQLDYDPRGTGALEVRLGDANPVRLELPAEHRRDGAFFNRFGLLNVQVPGNPLTVYLDDVRLGSGEVNGFDFPPSGWEGVGNQASFTDRELRGAHDFGYSRTNLSGGRTGELGGTFWRVEPEDPFAYYADRIEQLGLDVPLYASGTFAMTRASADSAMYLGWFNNKTIQPTPKNFLGVLVEGPSRAGHYFRPQYGTKGASVGDARVGPLVQPDGRKHTWSIAYDPAANGGNGKMTVQLDERTVSLNLQRKHRKEGAVFNRFGVFTMRRGGHYLTAYVDDLTYVAGVRPVPSA